MIPTHMLRKWSKFILPLCAGVVASLILLIAVSGRSAQYPILPKREEPLPPPPVIYMPPKPATPQPKVAPKKLNRNKTQTDAAELSDLAEKLNAEVSKMNVNILSFDVIQKTEEIEKLAKKLREDSHAK